MDKLVKAHGAVTVRLDVSHSEDEQAEGVVLTLVEGTSVIARDTGVRAGGGWPEYEFTGSAAEVELVVWRYFGKRTETEEVREVMATAG